MQEFFLGSGGMFGLLQALVGEGLPGSTPCVAVGNALLQGPVVLHIPQAVVNRIKDKAMTGDQGVVQLCVDMYRSVHSHAMPQSMTQLEEKRTEKKRKGKERKVYAVRRFNHAVRHG